MFRVQNLPKPGSQEFSKPLFSLCLYVILANFWKNQGASGCALKVDYNLSVSSESAKIFTADRLQHPCSMLHLPRIVLIGSAVHRVHGDMVQN